MYEYTVIQIKLSKELPHKIPQWQHDLDMIFMMTDFSMAH